MSLSTDTEAAPLQSALAEIANLDKAMAELNDKIDELKKRRDHLERIAIEEMTTQRLDGVKAAGRSWRIEWTHSFSAPEARKEAIELSTGAQKAKADALLLVAPYYNKPSPEGMFQHFRAIARAVDLPIMLYSVPGRCAVEITVETVERLAKECSNIRSLKEAGGKPERVDAIRKVVPADFEILSGDDGMTVEFMKRGARGVVSVASNLIPAEVKALVDAGTRKDWKKAEELHEKYAGVFRDLFIESNPGPVKAAMAAKGWLANELRLPLVPITEGSREKLFRTLKEAGLA